jgi:Zn-dependent protease with chaperone function
MCQPLAVSAALWLAGPRLARRLPPATAVRLLTMASLLTALATGFVLAVAAFLVLARVPAIAVLGHWSAATLSAAQPVPVAVGVVAGATVLALLASAARRGAAAGRDLAVAAATCRRLGPGVGGLVVVEDTAPDAYAVPGLSGRVVVSTAMLRALPADERRVLLAHEAAHLRHHHHLYVQLAELGAAANPLLRPLAAAVRAHVERWADEEAATEVQDRLLAARALARAGIARAQAARGARTAPHGALGAVDSGVAERTRALLGPEPTGRRGPAAVVVALMLLPVTAAALTAGDTEHRVDLAQSAWARQH